MAEEKNVFDTRAGKAADNLESTFQLISRARTGDQDATLELDGNAPLTHYLLGRAYAKLGDMANAIAVLERGSVLPTGFR